MKDWETTFNELDLLIAYAEWRESNNFVNCWLIRDSFRSYLRCKNNIDKETFSELEAEYSKRYKPNLCNLCGKKAKAGEFCIRHFFENESKNIKK